MVGRSRRELKRSSRSSSCGSESTRASPAKKPRIDLYVELRILLPNKVVGAIIGRGGENIKRLRRSFLANINLPTCIGPERVLTITADLSVTCKILADIIPTISAELNGTFVDDNELRILLQSRQAGALIGRRGKTIEELRERTESKIKVFEERCPDSTDQVVQVRGTTLAIIRCIRAILRTAENVHPSGGKQKYYDPNNFDSASVSKYGGYDHNETLTIKSQTKPNRQNSFVFNGQRSLRKGVSKSSFSTTVDETVSICSVPKPASVAADIPSMFSFLSQSGGSKPCAVPNSSPNNNADEDKNSVAVNPRLKVSVPYPGVLPTYPGVLPTYPGVLPTYRVHNKSQVARITETSQSNGKAETVSPLGVRTTSGSLPLLDSVASLVPPALQSNPTAKACLDRLLSALSCLVASSLSGAATRMHSVSYGNVNSATLSVAHDNHTAKNNSVSNDRCTKPVTTSQIGIPHDLVGIVLGKRHCRIKLMETMTSTKIWMDDVTNQPSDYVINITGSPEQINYAVKLIQSVIKKHAYGLRQRKQNWRRPTFSQASPIPRHLHSPAMASCLQKPSS